MTPHKKACFADGGAVSKADQLIAEMNAKYGVSGNAPAPKPATPAPQPQPAAPAQQPGSLIQRAAGIIGGRKEQIDKTLNSYACGGKVKAHSAGGKVKTIKGPGTSTSDSIPAKVKETGEQILVSNGERILSKKQDKLLDKIAKMLGYGSTDELLASGTGRPVGPTMKGGKPAAEDGGTAEEAARLARVEEAKRTGNLMATSQPTIGNATTALEYGNAQKNEPSVVSTLLPNTSAVYKESGKDVGEAMNKGNYGNAFGLATRGMLASGVGLVDDVVGGAYRGGKQLLSPVVAGISGSVAPSPSAQQAQNPSGLLPEPTAPGYGPKDGSQQQSPLVTGRNDKGVITAESALAAAGNDMSRSGGIYGTYDGKGVNDILARENKARGEMIALSMPQVGGTAPGILGNGSLGTLPGGQSIEEWNRNVGVKTQLGLDPKSRVAYEDQVAKNESLRRGQDLTHEAAMYGNDVQAQRAAGHDSVLMRGQDINAQTEAAKLAGSPYDKARAAEAEQITAMRGKFLDPKTPEDEKAKIKEYLSMINKKGGDGRQTAHVVGVYDSMGNKTGERLAVAPSGAEPSFYDPSAQRGQDKPVPTGYTVAGTSGGKRVLQDAKGNRFLEG